MIIKAIKKKIELSKKGTPFTRVLVQFDEYKDGKGNRVWISGFGNRRTWLWKVGDDVQPEVTQKDRYFNFSFDDTEENRLDVYALPATVGFVMDLLKARGGAPQSQSTQSAPASSADDVSPEDIPF